MNVLAHSLLSYSEGQVIGNLLEDYLGTIDRSSFSSEIQKGIQLHREIDNFTDHHEKNYLAREELYPAVGRYAPVFLDLIYDYFLANSLDINNLRIHADTTYAIWIKNRNLFPSILKKMVPFFISEDILFSLRYETGIIKSMNNMLSRCKYVPDKEVALEKLIDSYKNCEPYFANFYPELERHIKDFYSGL